MIVGGQTEARTQLSSTIIDYHELFDPGFTPNSSFPLWQSTNLWTQRYFWLSLFSPENNVRSELHARFLPVTCSPVLICKVECDCSIRIDVLKSISYAQTDSWEKFSSVTSGSRRYVGSRIPNCVWYFFYLFTSYNLCYNFASRPASFHA